MYFVLTLVFALQATLSLLFFQARSEGVVGVTREKAAGFFFFLLMFFFYRLVIIYFPIITEFQFS